MVESHASDLVVRVQFSLPAPVTFYRTYDLERTILIDGYKPLKFWQLAIKLNGYLISQIPPNEERAQFFMSLYDEKSIEYRVSFKGHRIEYI